MRRTELLKEADRSRFTNGYRVLRGQQEFVTFPDDSTIRVWYDDAQATYFDTHWHTAVEVLITLEGECIYDTVDGMYHVTQDDILIIPPRYPHNLNVMENTRRCIVLFEVENVLNLRDFNTVSEGFDKPVLVRADTPLRNCLFGLINRIVSLYRFRDPMWNTAAYSHILQMLVMLHHDSTASLESSREPAADAGVAFSAEMAESVLGYINLNFAADLTLESVASYVGYSKCYFARVFKQYTGVTFRQYLCKVRMNHARKLLLHSNESIGSVAAKSGFRSIATFNRLFMEMNNCSPTQYRLLYQHEADLYSRRPHGTVADV